MPSYCRYSSSKHVKAFKACDLKFCTLFYFWERLYEVFKKSQNHFLSGKKVTISKYIPYYKFGS